MSKLPTVGESRLPSKNKQPDKNNLNIANTPFGNFKLSANDVSNLVQGGISLFNSALEGKKTIAEIQANSDADIRKIEAEATKLLNDAKAKIGILNTKNQNWHSRFDKKQDLLTEIMHTFRTNTNLSESDKDKIFQMALKIISEEYGESSEQV